MKILNFDLEISREQFIFLSIKDSPFVVFVVSKLHSTFKAACKLSVLITDSSFLVTTVCVYLLL